MTKKVLVVFGTRPEAIKMAPLVKQMLEIDSNDWDVRLCVTAQHRGMLDQVLELFKITPDYDLNLMRPNQSLHELAARVLTEIEPVLTDFEPDLICVHGDTLTTLTVTLRPILKRSLWRMLKLVYVLVIFIRPGPRKPTADWWQELPVGTLPQQPGRGTTCCERTSRQNTFM